MKKLITSTTLVLAALCCTAQSYIEFTYDAAGNRTKRELKNPPPQVDPDSDNTEDIVADQTEKEQEEPENTIAASQQSDAPSTINLYPNPTKNNIAINIGNRFNPELDQSFELIDLNGKVVQTYPINQSVTKLRMGGIRSAMYYVHYKENGLIIESWKVAKVD